MEAADDIAYCMSDFEDGMEKGILAEEKFEEMLRERWDAAIQEDPYNQLDSKDKAFLPELLENASDAHVDRFIMFKTSLINSLIDYAVHQYLHNHNKMLDGTGGKLFKKGHKEYLALKCIKEVVLESVFRSREAESVELAGYSTIYGLLKHFSQLLEISAKEFKCLLDRNEEKIKNHGLDIHRRLFNRLSGKAVRAYEVAINNENVTEIEEWHFRGHLIVDYISGMTDDFALQTYQLLSGIKVEIN